MSWYDIYLRSLLAILITIFVIGQGPLIEELQSVGYDESNLAACGYDWRIPAHYLQVKP
jgi:hypothetical protein